MEKYRDNTLNAVNVLWMANDRAKTVRCNNSHFKTQRMPAHISLTSEVNNHLQDLAER